MLIYTFEFLNEKKMCTWCNSACEEENGFGSRGRYSRLVGLGMFAWWRPSWPKLCIVTFLGACRIHCVECCSLSFVCCCNHLEYNTVHAAIISHYIILLRLQDDVFILLVLSDQLSKTKSLANLQWYKTVISKKSSHFRGWNLTTFGMFGWKRTKMNIFSQLLSF